MKKITLILALLAAAGAAHAATIMQTETFAFIPDGSDGMQFDQFDTSLGTLLSVTVEVTLTKSNGSYSVDNDSDESGTISMSQYLNGSISSSDVSFLRPDLTTSIGASLRPTSTNGTSLTATTGDATDAFNATNAGDYVSWNPSSVSDSDDGSVFSGAWTSGAKGYLGTGTFIVSANAIQGQTATGISGLQGAYTASNATGSVTITYTYTPVPEASASLLALVPMAGLALRRRRSV